MLDLGAKLTIDRYYFITSLFNQLLRQKIKENGYLEIPGLGAFYSRLGQRKNRIIYGFYPSQSLSRLIEQRIKEKSKNG